MGSIRRMPGSLRLAPRALLAAQKPGSSRAAANTLLSRSSCQSCLVKGSLEPSPGLTRRAAARADQGALRHPRRVRLGRVSTSFLRPIAPWWRLHDAANRTDVSARGFAAQPIGDLRTCEASRLHKQQRPREARLAARALQRFVRRTACSWSDEMNPAARRRFAATRGWTRHGVRRGAQRHGEPVPTSRSLPLLPCGSLSLFFSASLLA